MSTNYRGLSFKPSPILFSNSNSSKSISDLTTNLKANNMFTELEVYFDKIEGKNLKDVQYSLEKYMFDFGMGTQSSEKFMHLISSKWLAGGSNEVLDSKKDAIYGYINALLINKNLSGDKRLYQEILNTVGSEFIFSIMIYHLLIILTYIDSDEEKFYTPTYVTIKVGKSLVKKYLALEKSKSSIISYNMWLKDYKNSNSSYDTINSDTFRSTLGALVMQILTSVDILNIETVTVSRTEKRNQYVIIDPTLLKISKKDLIKVVPLKLPMIVPTKDYDFDNPGGYLLNDVDYNEEIFTGGKTLLKPSVIKANNILHHFVNKASKIPFKVNTDLLDFIIENPELNLLIDSKALEVYEDKDAKVISKYRKQKYQSLLSKIIHQEYVLKIANLYKNFDKIYFPIRLDNRGRMYCVNSYFHYQSDDLSKALLIFSVPGIINKSNLEQVKWLEAYGANCFGGVISKGSVDNKVAWINKNLHNIVNYDNGILLKKAKEKLLFLAFCIEYKRYYNFLHNEHLTEFKTYLPIQLDATCNGFQHLSLLSQEASLYEELNITNESDKPKDFYTFILQRLHANISELSSNKSVKKDSDLYNSYKRLSEFLWERGHLKKAIMTIPYNGSPPTQLRSVLDQLHPLPITEEDKTPWFTDISQNNKCKINKRDIRILLAIIKKDISQHFMKIEKLIQYLKQVAKVCNALNLPINWCLPTGLDIYQSYLSKKSISITPFTYSKTKLNLSITSKNEMDVNKQSRALMPNLIHSLDASSMTSLYNLFSKKYPEGQFYSVHDCFGTTIDKVDCLKRLLSIVYVELYSKHDYLVKFDRGVIDYIKQNSNFEWKDRTIYLDSGPIKLPDIQWVVTNILENYPLKINAKHILV